MYARSVACFLIAYLAVLPGLPARGAPPATPDRKEKVVRTDRYGDPLPDGAVARLGTVRWRQAGTLSCVAFSADGKILASGSRDGQVYLWEVATGKELRRLTGHVN